MGVLDTIMGGLKGAGSFIANKAGALGDVLTKSAGVVQNPTGQLVGGINNTSGVSLPDPTSQILAGANQVESLGNAINNEVNGLPQNGGLITDAINNAQPQANKANQIVNAIKNSKANPTNWSSGARQTLSNALYGIGKTAFANPNENVLNNILGGVNSGIQNQINYKNAMNVMGQNGLDSSGLSPYADYSNLTWDKIQDIGIKQQQNQIRQQQNQMRQDIANANDNTKRLNLIMTALKNNTITPEEAQAQAKLYGLDFGSMQSSNETNRTNSQIEVNDVRKKQIEASIRQNDQRIKILQQKVAQGNATAGDKATLNKLNIENKKLIIEQNTLYNEALRNQLNNGGAGTGGGRPLGQRGGGRDSLGIL